MSNIKAVLVGAGILFSIFGATLLHGETYRDDFNGSALNTANWTFVNPLGDASYNMTGSAISINVPAGRNHDPWTTNQTPRIMRTVNDVDFEIQAKFSSRPSSTFQSQGVVVEQSSGKYIRLDVYASGGAVRAFVAEFNNGSARVLKNSGISSAGEYYLSIIRAGNTYYCRYWYYECDVCFD